MLVRTMKISYHEFSRNRCRVAIEELRDLPFYSDLVYSKLEGLKQLKKSIKKEINKLTIACQKSNYAISEKNVAYLFSEVFGWIQSGPAQTVAQAKQDITNALRDHINRLTD